MVLGQEIQASWVLQLAENRKALEATHMRTAEFHQKVYKKSMESASSNNKDDEEETARIEEVEEGDEEEVPRPAKE